MKLCIFDEDRIGLVDGETVIDVTSALDELAPLRYPLPRQDRLISHLSELKTPIETASQSGARKPLSDVRLHPPVANPGKLVAAPVNYTKHLQEAREQEEIHQNNAAQVRVIQEVGLFLKATSSLIGASDAVAVRFPERRTDHELELAVIIGRTADRVTAEQALDHVAAYAIGLDMTVRGSEERSMRKSIDTYSVLGPWLVTADEINDSGNLDMELSVDGEVRQKANTRDLVLSIPELIEMASSFYTLHPGDVIYTGTPEGVGPVTPGNSIDAWIEGIGSMSIQVS
ncbi:fumarylacetoacetate hydrolase family protein [Salipiger sp. P9]|uniref:fumarylacetoacetate hydrolase family protein n=1 Tax=Salipiger pentaromativorans TaxID=2943193 RepID=UPI00055F118D|nr:fumarylacetoacetate hydrolase family protein [Salipiger pentaromativorans]MCR8551054.1 fumarylacetoacetate hydrolase family protein [Salipiger pentaromativorans]